MARPSLPPAVLDELRAVVGDAHVVTDPDVLAGAEVDWTGRFRGEAPAMVRPADTAETSAVLAVCNALQVAVVPQGGNTGLVGGSVPRSGEVVLHLGRLDHVAPVEGDDGRVVAGAGATVAAIQGAAEAAGWTYGVDLASRDTATIGGTVATNAGGIHVLAYGDTRAQLLGLEVVLADGTVLSHLHAPEKDNTGYDLASLLCGSEGTLGVVTAAALRLHPPRPERTVALLAFDAVDGAVAASGRLRRELDELVAAELVLDDGMALVEEVTGSAHPLPERRACYLLVEAASAVDPTERLAAAVDGIEEVREVAVASDVAGRERLWRYREAHTEAIATLGIPHKLDVALPRAGLARFVAEVRDCVALVDPEARTWVFGHVEDGNVHVNVTGVDPDDHRVDTAVFELVASYRGSIAAEHGIGVGKRAYLGLSRTPEELAAFARIKAALDPAGILNPGVLLAP